MHEAFNLDRTLNVQEIRETLTSLRWTFSEPYERASNSVLFAINMFGKLGKCLNGQIADAESDIYLMESIIEQIRTLKYL